MSLFKTFFSLKLTGGCEMLFHWFTTFFLSYVVIDSWHNQQSIDDISLTIMVVDYVAKSPYCCTYQEE